MLLNTFVNNKKIYLAYNDFRKQIFSELSPRGGEYILYLLPWMLSINHPDVPGYVPDLDKSIAVFGATMDRTLIKREPAFKRILNIKAPGHLLTASHRTSLIQGIYTIGSAGTIGQTSASDCDIWICIDKDNFDDDQKKHLSQKVNLIKDWFDAQLKMPVYFFICDIEDIRNGNFGTLDDESSGSAQRNVLKEEFYRTSILIAGKILLWWVCFDPDGDVDYDTFAAQYAKDAFGDYDFIDMGPTSSIDSNEYFGAALWQFNKALTHPLKSVIKMLLLEMLLAAPGDELLCNRFRNLILNQKRGDVFCDPSAFTLNAILEYKEDSEYDTFSFIKQCCYLRHEIKFYTKKAALKETLAREIFQRFPLMREEIYRLNAFSTWPLLEQLEFGERILGLLTTIYKEITKNRTDFGGGLTNRDMTIIGRKLAVCLERKPGKIQVNHKPSDRLTHPNLIFSSKMNSWQVLLSGETAKPVVAAPDIVSCISHLVWNDLYQALNIRMTPNPTPITLQEIHNLAQQIREIFGVFDITGVDFENFLEPEKVTKMLVIVSFEGSNDINDINDFNVLYSNHWGELFFHRFDAPKKFKAFIQSGDRKFAGMKIYYYAQRNSLYYEKIIERTKMLVTHIVSSMAATSSGR